MANRKIYGKRGWQTMAQPRAVEDTMIGAVVDTLEALEPGPELAATALLARRYAELIDQGDDLAAAIDKYGQRLFACLEALKPSAKSGGGGSGTPARQSKLAGLREAHR